MKRFLILMLAALVWLVPAARSIAAPVTFWFSGRLNYVYNPSNTMPSGIELGTPFSGRITYDTAFIDYATTNSYPSGDTVNTYYRKLAGFSMMVHVGGHTITNATNSAGMNCGYVGARDQYDNEDALNLQSANSDLIVDGVSTAVGNIAPILTIYLKDSTKTAYNSAAIPSTPPTVSQFQSQRVFNWWSRIDDGMGTTMFSVAGDIDTIATSEIGMLNLKPVAGNAVQLSWPKSVTGLTLQFAASLTTKDWTTEPTPVVDTATEHTVTVSTVGQPKFFRLVRLP